MLVPGSQPGMPLQLQSLPLADAVVWLRDQVGPAEAASKFTEAVARAVQRDLTLHGTQIVLATREATELHTSVSPRSKDRERHCCNPSTRENRPTLRR